MHPTLRVRPSLWLALLALLTLPLQRAGVSGAVLAQSATAGVMAVVLLWGAVTDRAMQRTRLLFLSAMAVGLVAAALRVAAQFGGGGGSEWAEAVTLTSFPLTAAGLLTLPSAERRRGFRVRASADGLVAASSLWYFLRSPSLGHGSGLALATSGDWLELTMRPVVDVFVVATALAVFARCASSHRRLAAWALVGLTCIAAGDVVISLAPQDRLAAPDGLAGSLNQVGMLLLVAAAWSTRDKARPLHDKPWLATACSFLPFLPLGADMVLTSRMILSGRAMPTGQLLPALVVAMALMARQVVAARDKQRLVELLTARETALEDELRRDPLTGLGNRRLLLETLETALADPSAAPVVVALLDLDDFKLINDNHGHETGDAVLVQVAQALRRACRHDDVVVRLGGDEFAVVAQQVRDGGTALAARLVLALDAPVPLERGSFSPRASIGVVTADRCDSVAAALACADVAMYEAKARREPVTSVQILTEEGRHEARRRLRVREEIATPDLEQFAVVYQPVVELCTGRVRGVEALLRWNHPELGPISPELFIPLAETAGSIERLGEHVMQRAIDDLAAFQSLTPDRLAVGVNVSPRQLKDPRLVELALDRMALRGLASDQLNIEVTEQAFEADLTGIAANLQAFADAGVSVAVDDFGTGYSSLRYLQQLPVDIMKIDRSFVGEICESQQSSRLVSSIVAMAEVLDLQLIAEGIETAEQLAQLQAMGCELGQGYYFSRPIPADAIANLVTSRQALPVSAAVPQPRESGSSVRL